MFYYYIIVGLLWLIAIILIFIYALQSNDEVSTRYLLPYQRRDYLLSKAERSFYDVLKIALENSDMELFVKVRLADLFFLPSNLSKRVAFLNLVSTKNVDFVLCDTVNLKPLLAIELHDNSHREKTSVMQDEFVNRVFNDAGLPLVRIPESNAYSVQNIQTVILDQLRKKPLPIQITE